MLNEERVKYMTKLAMYEKNELREYAGMQSYARRDYVNGRVMLSGLVGTAAYLIAYGLLVVVLVSFVLNDVNLTAMILMILLGIVFYLGFIYLYLRQAARRAQRRYDKGRKAMAHFEKQLEGLQEIYQKEEE